VRSVRSANLTLLDFLRALNSDLQQLGEAIDKQQRYLSVWD